MRIRIPGLGLNSSSFILLKVSSRFEFKDKDKKGMISGISLSFASLPSNKGHSMNWCSYLTFKWRFGRPNNRWNNQNTLWSSFLPYPSVECAVYFVRVFCCYFGNPRGNLMWLNGARCAGSTRNYAGNIKDVLAFRLTSEALYLLVVLETSWLLQCLCVDPFSWMLHFVLKQRI